MNSLEILETRAKSVAGHLGEVSRIVFPALEGQVVVTGVGHSAGPARYLASLIGARFCPTSAFLETPPAADTLVVFSQHLSPNGRLPLAHAYPKTIVLTSDEHPLGVRLPPREEKGLLLRIAGPSIALFAAARLAGLAPSPGVASARAKFDIADFDRPLAIVAAGPHVAAYRALAWKFLEGWGVAEPPVYDALEVVHGPYQQFGNATILSCEHGSPELFDRVDTVLASADLRHVRFRSSLGADLALLEHDAMTTELLLEGLRAHPRDVESWPRKGLDAPLYDLTVPFPR